MVELIDVPTSDYGGSSGWLVPPLVQMTNEDIERVRQSDAVVRREAETLLFNSGDSAAISHHTTRLLLGGGRGTTARVLSWLSRTVFDVDIHHWQAHLH